MFITEPKTYHVQRWTPDVNEEVKPEVVVAWTAGDAARLFLGRPVTGDSVMYDLDPALVVLVWNDYQWANDRTPEVFTDKQLS